MPNNYILLETIALTQSAASVTFDNLPTSGYTDLKVVVSARTDFAGNTANIYLRPNGATTNLSQRELYGTGSAAASTTDTHLGLPVVGATATANTFGNYEAYIPNYRSSNNKSISFDAVTENNATAVLTMLSAGLWSNSAAITSIVFTADGNLVAGSTFSLYGVAALGTTPVLAPKATGGNIVENDGTYWIHTFTSSGNFVPQTGLTCNYLVVAGGGGGGGGGSTNAAGGGGGAGGYRTNVGGTAINFASNTFYTIAVGAGGNGAGSYASPGSQGTNSSISGSGITTISSTGGGGGEGFQNGSLATTGGSGGGGAGYNANTGTNNGAAGNAGGYTPVEGYAGGAGGTDQSTNSSGGGGGGSAGVGGNGNNSQTPGGTGGLGTANSVTGLSVTYAAGGVGGVANLNSNGANGTASRGNGGAGANGGNAGGGTSGGAGGSGIVIIRYPIA